MCVYVCVCVHVCARARVWARAWQIRIRWEGRMRGRRLEWAASSLTVGGRAGGPWPGRTILAPPAAERLRKSPWRLVGVAREEEPPAAAGGGGGGGGGGPLRAACLYREGAGYLVYRSA